MPTATVTTRLLNPRAYEADEFDPATQPRADRVYAEVRALADTYVMAE